MAIRFACACGKKLQARDDFGGMLMKCPACQRVLTIPAALEDAPATPRAAAVEVHFEEVTEVMPAVEEHIVVEGEAPPRLPPRPMPAPAPTALPVPAPSAVLSLTQTATRWRGDDQRLLDPDSARPDPRERSHRGRRVLAGLLIAAAVVAALVYGPELLGSRAGSSAWSVDSDLERVPTNAFAFASVRVSDLWDGAWLSELEQPLRERLADWLREETGLAPTDVERLTVVFLKAGDFDLGRRAKNKPAAKGLTSPPGAAERDRPRFGPAADAMTHFGAEFLVPIALGSQPDQKAEAQKAEAQKPKAQKPRGDGGPEPKKKKGGPFVGQALLAPDPVTARPPRERAVLVTTREPYDRRSLERRFSLNGVKVSYRGSEIRVNERPDGLDLLCVNDRLFVLANPEAMVALLNHNPGGKAGPLSGALGLAGQQQPFVFAVNGEAADFTRLPETLGLRRGQDATEIAPLLKLKALLVSYPDLRATQTDVRAQYTDEADAKAAGEALEQLIDRAPTVLKEIEAITPNDALFRGLSSNAAAALKSASIQTKDAELQVALPAKGLALAALLLYTQGVGEEPNRTRAENNLKEIAKALLAYEKEHKTLPPPAIGKNKGLSWRVAILPQLGQQELYEQFHLDENWDSEHNKALLKKVPAVYAPEPGSGAEREETFYQVFTGPKTAFHGGDQPLSAFTDGLALTFLVVENSRAARWTAPEDIHFLPKSKLKVGAQFPGIFLAVFADGKVYSLPRDMPSDHLERYVTPAAGDGGPAPGGLAPPKLGGAGLPKRK